jgi:hypothetical protein
LKNSEDRKKAREEAFKHQKKEMEMAEEMAKAKKKEQIAKLGQENKLVAEDLEKQKELLTKETKAKLAQIEAKDKQTCQTIFKEVETSRLNLEQRARETACKSRRN